MKTAVLFIVVLNGIGQAQPNGRSDAKKETGWSRVFMQQALEHEIYSTASPADKFRLLPSAIFRWENPARGPGTGSVFLWVQEDDRPAVIGQVFRFPHHKQFGFPDQGGDHVVAHAFHSLADGPIMGVWRQRTWAPAKAGIEWKPVPDAPVPADSTGERMRQIRLLSRRFEAHSIDYEGGRWELRLVPKPLYRWESKDSDAAVRGALLALCQGTDVEILLMIEARKTATGPLWHYACAQFGDFAMHLRLDGIDVWSVPRAPIRDLRGPFLQDVVERRDAPKDAETPKED